MPLAGVLITPFARYPCIILFSKCLFVADGMIAYRMCKFQNKLYYVPVLRFCFFNVVFPRNMCVPMTGPCQSVEKMQINQRNNYSSTTQQHKRPPTPPAPVSYLGLPISHHACSSLCNASQLLNTMDTFRLFPPTMLVRLSNYLIHNKQSPPSTYTRYMPRGIRTVYYICLPYGET